MLGQIRLSIAKRTGLAPQDWVLTARVQERMQVTQIGQVDRYFEALQGRTEFTALIELLRVGETRFFRHESHIRAMTELVLPRLREETSTLHVWSAGCATGEEPYTLAMLLSRELGEVRDTEVLASDISPDSLQLARAAIYHHTTLSKMPASYRELLVPLDDGRFQVPTYLQTLVRFEERNLATAPYPGAFDLVFCRNVLIYFEEQAKKAALGRLVRALKPGGFLFLGYSESLRDVEGLREVRGDGCVAYQRVATEFSDIPVTSQPSPAPPKTPSQEVTYELCLHGEYRDGHRLSDELDRALARHSNCLIINLDGADYLAPAAANVLREARGKAHNVGTTLQLQATREGHQRFLRRHELS